MKYYEIFDYFEHRYGNNMAIQILDEMPPEGFVGLLEPSEIVKFYQQKFKGLWDRYCFCCQAEEVTIQPEAITRLLRNMHCALKDCLKARS